MLTDEWSVDSTAAPGSALVIVSHIGANTSGKVQSYPICVTGINAAGSSKCVPLIQHAVP